MGERTSHTPGTFSWTDLATSDAEDAKRFYIGLFGWEPDDQPIPAGGVYTMMQVDGKAVAALFAGQEGMPTAWSSYVTVESADAAAARAQDLGGTPMGEPFDVMEAGRMAVIQDPTGAVFSVWEPRGSIGAELVNVPGALTMTQLNTPDPEAAQRFYEGLFGWRFESVAGGDQPFWGIYNGDRLNAGMMELAPEAGTPPHWLAYFVSEDADADAGRIGELGGQVIVPPMEVPGGRILVAQDPQGAVFGLFSGRLDD
jgi:predicted enzyme related to lactoylglutathione lyase